MVYTSAAMADEASKTPATKTPKRFTTFMYASWL